MKKVFMRILDLANYEGDVTEANLYRHGKYATIKFETPEGEIFTISVTKEEKEEKAND